MHGRAARGCPVCEALLGHGFEYCRGCEIVGRQLGVRLAPVLPVRLAPRSSTIHRLVVAYKAAPSCFVRREAAARLTSMLAEFLEARATSLAFAGRPLELLTTVPSTGAGRPSWRGVHPLVTVVARACEQARTGERGGWQCAQLLERGPGALGHVHASGDGYVAVPAREPAVATAGELDEAVRAIRLVVVDDLYTSGAHAQSAARALGLAGFEVAAVVPLARLVAAGDPRLGRPLDPVVRDGGRASGQSLRGPVT